MISFGFKALPKWILKAIISSDVFHDVTHILS